MGQIQPLEVRHVAKHAVCYVVKLIVGKVKMRQRILHWLEVELYYVGDVVVAEIQNFDVGLNVSTNCWINRLL